MKKLVMTVWRLPVMVIKFCIRCYQKFLNPVMHFFGGPMAGCRFTPSCSNFCMEAVEVHGAVKGSWMGLRRICRCHPWGGCGHDPVPPKK